MRWHRRGAPTKQATPRRPQPEGLVPIANDLRRHSSSAMPSHRLLLVPCSSVASGTSEMVRIYESLHWSRSWLDDRVNGRVPCDVNGVANHVDIRGDAIELVEAG